MRLGLCALLLAVLTACDRPAPAVDVGTIAGMDGPDLAGQPVQIPAARVQQVVNDRAFWIGTSTDRRVLVVLQDQSHGRPANLQEGQTVNLIGTVERVPTELEGVRRLKLPETAEDLLRIQVVYVLALQAE